VSTNVIVIVIAIVREDVMRAETMGGIGIGETGTGSIIQGIVGTTEIEVRKITQEKVYLIGSGRVIAK
jgi:hypothetical protein